MHYTPSLDGLADDILIQILQVSSVREILTLRCTSKRFYSLSKVYCVWYAVFCTEVLARRLPPPGPSCSLSALSSADLEYRTLLALALERRWSQSKANVIVSSGEREIVDQIVLVPGGMQVLTVHGNKVMWWLISGKPGSHELHNIGAWSLPSDDTCIVVKDMERQGIIAIGSRDKDSPNRHATVFSLSLKPALNKLCDYSLVPGTIAGISRHLLFLDTTSQQDGGGLEVLDWHAKTEGTALLPRIPELFGAFLGLVHFSDHILVTWEACISVFPVPNVPAKGRTVVAHTKIFMFYEQISSPIAFTACVSRGWSDADADAMYATSQEAHSLTLATRGKSGGISLSMLILLGDDEGGKYPSSFPYRLLRLSTVVPNVIQDLGGCMQICLGSSGRGLFVYDGKFGPEFETERVVYEIEPVGVGGGDKIDFDEGMGRLVVAKGSGGFDVMQLL
ncbi:uncharacterized protein F5891DRAFT_979354 [Suillus fuscotomentosus]|uniref:F-box domain-containing protein n=1 Tax=Suillus fuscotomentosus TaxID=1912939 RepID=A0AAD4E878_9AGAM|nr:uncharacterized protein F5891DRAFT_979354 [Suillus fuscotomentosus]KAG1901523.1 hypothetical protein F5891DRAFT_979354 [Suillus fuscotomentosus]